MAETAVAVAQRPRRARARSRWDAAAIAVIVLGLGIRGYVLWRSWWWQDDFAIADSALRNPLSVAWLLQDYNGHLEPSKLLLVWVGMRVAPMSWPAACAVVLLWSAIYSIAIWALARRLFGPGPGALLGTAVAVLSPLWAVSTSWFASATETVPTFALVVLAAYCLVRLAGGGRSAWGVASALAYAAALSWHEKAALGLALIAFVVVLMRMRGGFALRRRAVLLTLVAIAGMTLAYAVVYVRLVGGIPSTPASTEAALRLVHDLALSFVPTGLVGGPWVQGEPGTSVQPLITQPWLLWIWVAVLGTAVVGWRRHRPSAVVATLAVTLWVAVDVALLIRARLGLFGLDVGSDPRYVVDVLPVAGLALAALVAGGSRTAVPRLSLEARRALTAGAAAVAVLYGVIAWPSWYSVAESRAAVEAESWVHASLAAVDADPTRTFVDGLVPSTISIGVFGDTSRTSRVLGLFGAPSDRFGVPAGEWWALDGQGVPRVAVFTASSGGPVGALPRCGVGLLGNPVVLDVPDPGRFATRISYYAASDVSVVVESGTSRWVADAPRGVGFLLLPGERLASTVTLSGLGADESMCISAVESGTVL